MLGMAHQLLEYIEAYLRGQENYLVIANMRQSSPEAVARVAAVARGYSNLEYDLDEGERGSRYAPVVELLTQLTGAEDALVVNNCAGAVLLALGALCGSKEVVLSRGEMIEIGGDSGDWVAAASADTCALYRIEGHRIRRKAETVGGKVQPLAVLETDGSISIVPKSSPVVRTRKHIRQFRKH